MKLTFEEHVEKIKSDLNLDKEVQVLVGDCAFKYVEENYEIYYKKHKISLEDEFRKLNGLYLWVENDNTVLVKSKKKIGTLAHELRHAWQFKNRDEYGFDFDLPKGKIKRLVNIIKYPVSKKELDANKFALHYCKVMGLKKIANIYFVSICLTWIFRLIYFLPVLGLICGFYVLIKCL